MKKNNFAIVQDSAHDEFVDDISPKNDFKIVKEENSVLNTLFYQLSNHHEVYHLGKSYLADFENGAKHFAISSINLSENQQKVLLGIASFFDHFKDLKIGIFGENLDTGLYKQVLADKKCTNLTGFVSSCGSIKVSKFENDFDFISIEPQKKNSVAVMNSQDYKKFISGIIEQYDLVLWDVPTLAIIQNNIPLYFPLIVSSNSLTLIVAEEQMASNELTEVMSFFNKYGVPTKGALLDKKIPQGKIVNHKVSWVKRLFLKED